MKEETEKKSKPKNCLSTRAAIVSKLRQSLRMIKHAVCLDPHLHLPLKSWELPCLRKEGANGAGDSMVLWARDHVERWASLALKPDSHQQYDLNQITLAFSTTTLSCGIRVSMSSLRVKPGIDKWQSYTRGLLSNGKSWVVCAAESLSVAPTYMESTLSLGLMGELCWQSLITDNLTIFITTTSAVGDLETRGGKGTPPCL